MMSIIVICLSLFYDINDLSLVAQTCHELLALISKQIKMFDEDFASSPVIVHY